MTELSDQALVYLVQLVDQELKRLTAEVQARHADDPILADIEEELLDCSQVVSELQAMYENAAKTSGNMPRYSQLVEP
jgi:hypothetical protein